LFLEVLEQLAVILRSEPVTAGEHDFKLPLQVLPRDSAVRKYIIALEQLH
jgi:hypothetical protein